MKSAAPSQITVSPSGRAFAVETGETILNAAIRQGVPLPYGCKDGACGSCRCRKLEGSVSHGAHSERALSAQDESMGYILTCCGVPDGDVVLESRQVGPDDAFPVKRMPIRVSFLEQLSPDVMVLKLQLPSSETWRYHAGQYIEFLLRDGSRRSYSMANAPHHGPGVELHIRHVPGGKFTDHVFGGLREKEVLRLEGPYGSFYLREDTEKPLILLASGTGFAPIKAVLEHLKHIGSERAATLYWGGRRPSDLYLDAWVRELTATMPNLRYIPVLSGALPEDGWEGCTGYVHRAAMVDFPDMSGLQVYACGAPIVVDSARNDYTSICGLPPEEFFADSFITQSDKSRPEIVP